MTFKTKGKESKVWVKFQLQKQRGWVVGSLNQRGFFGKTSREILWKVSFKYLQMPTAVEAGENSERSIRRSPWISRFCFEAQRTNTNPSSQSEIWLFFVHTFKYTSLSLVN